MSLREMHVGDNALPVVLYPCIFCFEVVFFSDSCVVSHRALVVTPAMHSRAFALVAVCGVLESVCALRLGARDDLSSAISRAEEVLTKECGEECVLLLRSVLNASTASTSSSDMLSSLATVGLERLESHDAFSKQLAHQTSQARALTNAATGTACNSPAECALREAGANRCNYGRVALQNTYNSLNVVAHVMGAAISSLCGCIHVDRQSRCVLANVPATCVFPYTVYSKVFAGTVQAWEAVKASTKNCMIHRGPAIQR